MNPWWSIARDAGRLAVDAQTVVALRLARLARGGKRGRAEARRMVDEKVDALLESQADATKAMLAGKRPPAIVKKTIEMYGRRVRRNRRR
ncbi:MAG: hypothetical protein J2P47_15215, partial [Acetobacteraceae bacterium]|nr:hypothetical protein [Acetobacteraceae bacterium]